MGRKTPKTLYLYPDKHAVLVYEEEHAKSRERNRWAEVLEKVDVTLSFHGTSQVREGQTEEQREAALVTERKDRESYCLVFEGGAIPLVLKAKHIDAWDNNSSPANDERGITVRTLHVYLKGGGDFCLNNVTSGSWGISSSDGFILVPSRCRDYEHAKMFADHASAATFALGIRVAAVHHAKREEGVRS